MHVSVVGIPESARVGGFCAALRAAGFQEPAVLSWVDVLDGATPSGIIRLESPGRSWNTERRLLLHGAGEADEADTGSYFTRMSPGEVNALSEPAGRIVAMRQWYLGWRKVLRDLEARTPGAHYFSAPGDIACMFDKELCQQRVEAAGCAMPRSLGVPTGFEDLMERMRAAHCPRVFLKACHGSSASGVIALETSRGRVQAFSTARLAGGVLWNTRPGQWLRDLPGIIALVDAVCRERAQAQAWVPKMGWRGHRVDLRIVTIGGFARHAVLRMSRTPFTNLQLHNRRGDVAEFASEHAGALERAREMAGMAATAFPKSLSLGVDVAISPDGRPWVLEVNAFGDLLPGCLDQGWDTYRWQAEFLRGVGFPL